MTAADHGFMARALRLAERGLYSTDPNPRVGCVVVRDGAVIGEGWHARAGGAHAEIVALGAAGAQARGATVYVTLEPCRHEGRTPPCTAALIDAGVARVVAAMADPDPRNAGAGLASLRAAGIRAETGLMAAEAARLNPGFVHRHRLGRPWVRCKLGITLDGRTAMADGESRWITGPAAREDVHWLRARSSAIMTGIGTILTDDPALTVRLAGRPEDRQPLRVVVDTRLETPPEARLLGEAGETLIAAGAGAPAQRRAVLASRNRVSVRSFGTGRVDLGALLQHLAARQANEVLLEAGPRLSGAMVEAGLIDEFILYLAPKLLGDSARGMFALPGVGRLAEAPSLEVLDVRPVGSDWRIVARPAEVA